jgi:superfamily II DNA or RNA helicase
VPPNARSEGYLTVVGVTDARRTLERPIFLTREGGVLKLSFAYNQHIVERVKLLPFATYDGETRSWSVAVTREAVDALRDWFITEGLTDVCVDELIGADETVKDAAAAVLRRGSLKRPFLVQMGARSDVLFNRLRALPGAQWEKAAQAMSYPPGAAAALGELVSRGVLDDPQNLLRPADVTVMFDVRTGVFKINGDSRAQQAFDRNFPGKDIVSVWHDKGFDVAFSDPFAEEVYRGEVARNTELYPDGLLEPLFAYQAQSVAVAVERNGFAVWDAPGLGKTAQAIAWGHELIVNRQEAERCVIVTPGAVKTQFGREITRFTGHTDVVVIDGDKKKRDRLYEEAKTARWVVLNYDLLHLDFKKIVPLVNGQLLVADEAHRLKGRASKRGQAARQLAQKAVRRLALSGTPVENDPAEWYTLMSGFVVPGVFGSPMEFFNRYSYPGRFGGFEGARNLGELRDRSKPHYIRHRKEDVAKHLPPLRVQNFIIDPDDKLAAALKRAHRDAQEEIADAAKVEKAFQLLDDTDQAETGAAMTAVGMLRMMCASPRLVWQSEAESAKALCEAGLIPDVDGPKVDEIRVLAAQMQENGERLVVFTSFRSMADLVAERFKTDGIRYVLYTGTTSTKDRDAAARAFTTPATDDQPGPTVFLATDAAAEGLNLGKCCSTLVNLDLPFKPSTLIQRGNRIHRVDGDPNKKYLVINYTMARTVEEGIIRLIGAKADLSDAILGEAGSRKATTGRQGRSVFEEAIRDWA